MNFCNNVISPLDQFEISAIDQFVIRYLISVTLPVLSECGIRTKYDKLQFKYDSPRIEDMFPSILGKLNLNFNFNWNWDWGFSSYSFKPMYNTISIGQDFYYSHMIDKVNVCYGTLGHVIPYSIHEFNFIPGLHYITFYKYYYLLYFVCNWKYLSLVLLTYISSNILKPKSFSYTVLTCKYDSKGKISYDLNVTHSYYTRFIYAVLAYASYALYIYLLELLVLLFSYLGFSLGNIILILSIVLNSININNKLLFILVFFSNFTFTLGSISTSLSGIPLYTKQLIVTPLGAILHWLFGFMYDYLNFKTKHKNSYIINKIFNFILLGIIYAVYIFIGVLYTNGIWFFVSQGIPRGLLFVLSTGFTILFAAGWHYLVEAWKEHNKLRSLLRSFCETLAFASVAVASYCVWFMLPTKSLTSYIIITTIFSVLHLIASAVAINWEYKGKHTILYGLSYFVSFLFGSTATSGIYNLYITLVTNLQVHYRVAAVTFVITVLLAPDFYRKLVTDPKSGMKEKLGKRSLFYSTLSYFLLFISFVVYTGLLNSLFIG